MGQSTKLNVINKVLEQGEHWLEYESGFQEREYPKGVFTFHKGDDLLGKNKGTDYVVAIDNGIVTKNTYSTSRGYYVELKMNNGFFTRYLHLKKGSILVKVGQKVTKGQRLGYMGNSGYYTDANGKKKKVGTHLHFAVANANGTCIDPMPYLMGEKSFDNGDWVVGASYVTLFNKYARTSPKVSTNKARYKNLKETVKYKFIKDSLGYAKYKIGVTIVLNEFKKDSKGNTWGRTGSLWLCVNDSTGDQVKKV